jgi:hypothetical protein
MKNMRTYFIIMAIMVLVSITGCSVFGGKNSKAIVMSPTSNAEGLSYGEWLARWWQYALTLPNSQNPLTGGTGENCVFQRIGNVGLVIANSTLSEPIKCEVPAGMMLYIEVLGAECSTLEEAPFYGGNEEELRACAEGFIPEDMEASIDGIEVKDLSKYFVTSPIYEFTEPEDNILEVPAGSVGQSIGSGVYLIVSSLSPGKHTIHVRGTYASIEYTADKTFDITVTE